MRRLHVPGLPRAGEVRVAGEEGHHVTRVLRARAGDRFGLFDGRGREVHAEVVEVARGSAVLRILEEVEPRRPARDVLLLTAVPRGQRMEWLVEKCTEAGAGAIVPLVTARGVRDRASRNTMRRWQRAAVEAAKQCGRADVPEVAAPTPLADALERMGDRVLLAADPRAATPLAQVLPPSGGVALLIGPEGGLEETEDAVVRAAGATPVGLGPLVLRIETAAVVATHAASR